MIQVLCFGNLKNDIGVHLKMCGMFGRAWMHLVKAHMYQGNLIKRKKKSENLLLNTKTKAPHIVSAYLS